MLVAALVLAFVGFLLLVASIYTGKIIFTFALIAVVIVGLILVLIDMIRGRGRRS